MSEAADFDALTGEFFAVWLRYHPEAALRAGIVELNVVLPAQSDDDQAALAGLLETLIVALEEMDYAALDAERRLDLELMFALARAEHRELLEHDWRHRDPLAHLPVGLIHRLTLAPLENLRGALVPLLRALPDHLRLALTQLQPTAALVPPVLLRATIAAARDGREYLRALARSRWLRSRCSGTGEIEHLAESAGAALRHYAEALERDIAPLAAAPPGCGEDRLRLLLARRHWLEIDPQACIGLLDELAADCEQLLARLPAPPAEEAIGEVALADRLRGECRAIAARLDALGVRLPPNPLRIAGGPAAPHSGGSGIDYVADLRTGAGLLYLAAGDGRHDGAATGLPTGAELRLRCLRLGWGGDHALAFGGGMAARSLPRRTACGQTLRVGSALCLETRLLGASADPAERHAVLRARRQAIVAARVDLQLNRGAIGIDDAIAALRESGEDETAGLCRAAGMLRRPGDALAGVLGWRLIEALMAGAADAHPGGTQVPGSTPFDPLLLERLRSRGPIPLALAIRHGLGEDAWQRAAAALGCVTPQSMMDMS